MKTISVTHIDTGGHGYLSVSKKDILAIGIDYKKFTSCSGHTLSRMYLEEDYDARFFRDYCNKAGITVKETSSYNERFAISHNYKSKLFNYQPAVNDRYEINKRTYVVTQLKGNKRIIIRDEVTGFKYRISTNNPFNYIQKVLSVVKQKKYNSSNQELKRPYTVDQALSQLK